MKIGVPRERKNNENRVALTPAGAHELTAAGHEVVVERDAGRGSAISDDDYAAAGAKVLEHADDVWGSAELVLKVKEPIAEEYHRMRSDQVLFTYLHLAASRECTDALLRSGTTGIAYETVQTVGGGLPLLAPMSEVAGRLAPQVGAHALLRPHGGRGVLPAGIPGVDPARVAVIGGGVAGLNAARVAAGMGSDVTVLDTNPERLRHIDEVSAGRIRTLASNSLTVAETVTRADLVVGAVLLPGARAPKLVGNDLVADMKSGSVLVDIAIDQGGCFEASRPTTHDDPTFTVGNSVFYCVANMPGAVPRTSTFGLTNATLPYVLRIANQGVRGAIAQDRALRAGVNTVDGAITYAPVAEAFGLAHISPEAALG